MGHYLQGVQRRNDVRKRQQNVSGVHASNLSVGRREDRKHMSEPVADVSERFWSHVDRSGGPEACWPWVGRLRNQAGYGSFRTDGKTYVAHRWLLGHLRGEPLKWPDEIGCHRDVCGTFKGCCNPTHIYVGSHTQNADDAIRNGRHGGATWKFRTHCIKGHEFTPENTHWFGPRKSLRYCRTCKRDTSRESQRKRQKKLREEKDQQT